MSSGSFPKPVQLNRWLPARTANFELDVRYSRRRSMELRIQQGRVKLYAPSDMPVAAVQAWLKSRTPWVQATLARQADRLAEVPRREGRDGEHWPLLGETLILRCQQGRYRAERRGEELWLWLPRNGDPLRQLSRWYQDQAAAILQEKTVSLAQGLGLTVAAVKLRRTKTKWGHCTRQGVIQYNWLIVQAPEWVVDYLVAHEVCHLRHPHHGRAFWALVASVFPHYQKAEAWLKNNGHCLTL